MKNKITSMQVATIAYFAMLSCCIGISTHNTIQIDREDSWISILIGFIIGFIPLLIFININNYKTNLSIVEKIEYLFGKWIGKGINTILAISVLFMITLLFYDLNNFVSSQYINKTPTWFISILFLIPIIYCITKNIKVLGRTAFILFMISILLLFLSIFGLIFQVHTEYIFPILKNGFSDVFKGALSYTAYNLFSIYLIMTIPKDNMLDKEKLNKRIIAFYILGNLSMFIMIYFLITVFGIEIANLYQYPEFHLLKRVSIFGFIDRVESTLSLRWLFYIFITICIGLFYFKEYIRVTFNIKYNNLNNFIIMLISVFVTIISTNLFSNNTISNYFVMNILPSIILIIFTIIPIFILIKLDNTK